MNFYKCDICDSTYIKLEDGGGILSCCGKECDNVIFNKKIEESDKHVPIIKIKDNEALVIVGSIPHPITANHYISYIVLETNLGFYIRYLRPIDEPLARFKLLEGEKVIKAYASCNIHGLWKSK